MYVTLEAGSPSKRLAKPFKPLAAVSHGSTWIPTSGRKAIQPLIVYEIRAHLEVVIINHPGEGVSKGCQVLALLAVSDSGSRSYRKM